MICIFLICKILKVLVPQDCTTLTKIKTNIFRGKNVLYAYLSIHKDTQYLSLKSCFSCGVPTQATVVNSETRI